MRAAPRRRPPRRPRASASDARGEAQRTTASPVATRTLPSTNAASSEEMFIDSVSGELRLALRARRGGERLRLALRPLRGDSFIGDRLRDGERL